MLEDRRWTEPGRPSLYKPEFAEQAYGLCLAGATNQELADGFDVGRSTIDNWLRKYPEFAQAVRSGRSLADGKVAHGLYARAIGYDYEATRVLLNRGGPVCGAAHGASPARRQGLHLLAAQPPSAAMGRRGQDFAAEGTGLATARGGVERPFRECANARHDRRTMSAPQRASFRTMRS